jgi:EAL domain-containing protein (putative c-di-GMP-specific phosphodiesterase class I)/DNA-binding NarL/FixJ family response regulator
MRALIFDDEDAVGRLIVRTANMAGIDAVSVVDAASFAAQLQGDPPHVVLLDLQLGATDGVAQLRVLAEHNFTGAIVLMSGFDGRVLGSARTLGQSLGLKIADTLEKPLRLGQLEHLLDRLCHVITPLTLERLRRAIAEDEMTLDFQPIATRNPKTLLKLEALVRWEHPTMGRIPPGEFLPIAESDAATMDSLTDWVLGAALEAYHVLAELGVSVPMSLNMSMRGLQALILSKRFEQRIRDGNMPAKHLQFEITESAAFADVVHTVDILSRLRLKGIEFAIDDFGTGYSSLKLLQQMPFSEIKVDRTFVTDLTSSCESQAIVRSIRDLAANMGLSCVAEGIESDEIAVALEQLGVHSLQGYFIARPMPVEAVPIWLAYWTGAASLHHQTTAPVHEPEASAVCREPSQEPFPLSPTGRQRHSVRLPPRQLQVMQLLSEGLAVKEIARKLSLGTGTVKVHLSLAYSALGARNRVEAIRRAGPLLRPVHDAWVAVV